MNKKNNLQEEFNATQKPSLINQDVKSDEINFNSVDNPSIQKSSVEKNNEISETPNYEKTSNIKKKSLIKFNPITGVVAIIMTAIIGVSFVFTAPTKITLNDFKIGGSYYAYNIRVENINSLQKVKLLVYNDYFSKEILIKNPNIIGMVEGLNPDTKYTAKVMGSKGLGEKTYFSQEFKTLKDNKPLKSEVTAKYARKPNDNNLYINVFINDFLCYYSNYKMFYKSNSDNIPIDIIGKITDEQHLSLDNIKESSFIIFITANTTKPSDNQNNITNTIVYSANVQK